MPHTQQWLDYWTAKLDRLINGEGSDEKLPVAFLDVLIVGADVASSGSCAEGSCASA